MYICISKAGIMRKMLSLLFAMTLLISINGCIGDTEKPPAPAPTPAPSTQLDDSSGDN